MTQVEELEAATSFAHVDKTCATVSWCKSLLWEQMTEHWNCRQITNCSDARGSKRLEHVASCLRVQCKDTFDELDLIFNSRTCRLICPMMMRGEQLLGILIRHSIRRDSSSAREMWRLLPLVCGCAESNSCLHEEQPHTNRPDTAEVGVCFCFVFRAFLVCMSAPSTCPSIPVDVFFLMCVFLWTTNLQYVAPADAQPGF